MFAHFQFKIHKYLSAMGNFYPGGVALVKPTWPRKLVPINTSETGMDAVQTVKDVGVVWRGWLPDGPFHLLTLCGSDRNTAVFANLHDGWPTYCETNVRRVWKNIFLPHNINTYVFLSHGIRIALTYINIKPDAFLLKEIEKESHKFHWPLYKLFSSLYYWSSCLTDALTDYCSTLPLSTKMRKNPRR